MLVWIRKKYKKCHEGREDQKPPELWELNKGMRKAFGKKLCSCPGELKKIAKGIL